MSEFQLHLPVMLRGGEPSAVVTPCRAYRYRLTRVWDPDKPRLGWVMLAASEAGEQRPDSSP
jgi:hypothetical protein